MKLCLRLIAISVLAILLSGCPQQPVQQGPPGPQGVQGEKGPPGDKGAVGDKGPTGNKGPSGDKGPTGDKGLSGDKGPLGDRGPQGAPGPGGSTSDVVGKPGGLPPYKIVAGGLLRGDGINVGPVFNGLKLTRGSGQGELVLAFNGYVRPDGTFQYIVKASAASSGSGGIEVAFGEFRTEGIIMKVLRNGTLVPFAQLAQAELMIEISQIQGN